MSDLNEIKKKVEASFISAVASYLNLHKRERNGSIYITDLVERCMRKAYWDITRQNGRMYDEKDVISLGVGTLVHTLPLSQDHEVKLQYRNIIGRLDDIINTNDYTVIIDKKTCSAIPAEQKEQHVNQVRYYAVLFECGEREENGEWVQNEGKGQKYIGTVLYIDLNNGRTEAKVFHIDVEQTKAELDAKIDLITRAMEEGKVPESTYGWWCGYCPWYLECRLLDGQDLSKVQSIPV